MIEPLSCRDCGIDTAPCTGRRGCRHKGRWEYYMVVEAVWVAAGGMAEAELVRQFFSLGLSAPRHILCIGCLERRIGRPLLALDFTDASINDPGPWDTPRLAARRAAVATASESVTESVTAPENEGPTSAEE